ncbi:MAG: tRNA uridine-5-carboxymethylaminomethyl(34) synthesis GTPase MnmE [Clostridia bacterium]|nr:tRNA uridine-5-carboxymethylaminomethyl(34) synthesis GTPase MnmE [Clostridia bacterium]
MNDCISAISTAKGAAGVAIIRLSGEGSLEIAKKMFKSKNVDFEPYKLYVGKIDCENFSDFGMCVYFKAPKSYTGEDMVEFHCHGGVAISNAVLKQTFRLGARPATNGEFTKRAFLNGKLSLSSCEGLIDMINGETEMEAKCGFYLYRERLFNNINQKQAELTNILAQIDVDIDYPEDDVPTADETVVKNRLLNVYNDIEKLISTYFGASKAKKGVKIALCGKPNAGKSSILNTLLRCDKAIVTDIEGTTRDIVEGSIEINGVSFNLFDTAGIRESLDKVEKIGIERSLKAIETADLVVFVVDAEKGFDKYDREILNKITSLNYITVLNKSDVCDDVRIDCDIKISAKTGENIEEFKQLIFNKSKVEKVNFDADFVTEERHFYALKDASNSLKSAIENIGVLPLDIVTVDIKDAWHYLGLISGQTSDQAVIDEIFAKFCVGK